MDIDQDGVISYDSMNLCSIPTKQLELIQDILFKLEDHSLRLNRHDFIAECRARRLILEQQQPSPRNKKVTG